MMLRSAWLLPDRETSRLTRAGAYARGRLALRRSIGRERLRRLPHLHGGPHGAAQVQARILPWRRAHQGYKGFENSAVIVVITRADAEYDFTGETPAHLPAGGPRSGA